jgi:Concanavalin A-like lectin/glucanases superfamily
VESGSARQKWKLNAGLFTSLLDFGAYCYVESSLRTGYGWNVWGGSRYEGVYLCMHPDEYTWNMQFFIEKVELLPAKEEEIRTKRTRIAEIDAALVTRNSRLTELTALLAQNDTEATVLGLLTTARTNLNSATTAGSSLATSNTTYLSGRAALSPLTMPVLATDRRGLSTQGAVLDFVRPSGRVSVAETCDGNVLLTYADSQGRLCQTAYDAAADSRNAAFDQWLPPAGRAGASFGSSGSLALASPVKLPDGDFTFETWFQFPLPFKDDGTNVSYYPLHAFASDASGENIPLAVAGGDRLVLVAGGMFHDSGARLSSRITAGWHHAAVVTRGPGADFYLDGIKVGTASRTLRGLTLNGTTDSLSVPAFAWPTTTFTISIWVKSATASWNNRGALMRWPPPCRSAAR